MWDIIRAVVIIVGIIVFILLVVFLYLLIAGADESRRKEKYKDKIEKNNGSQSFDD